MGGWQPVVGHEDRPLGWQAGRGDELTSNPRKKFAVIVSVGHMARHERVLCGIPS